MTDFTMPIFTYNLREDIRSLFDLCEYHDKAEIMKTRNGFITFKVTRTGDMFVRTETFCKALGATEEFTLYWILKYGKFLPKHISKL